MRRDSIYVIGWVVVTLICVSVILLFSGCYSQKKAVRQAVKAYSHYPGKISELGAIWWPIKTFTKDSIIYRPGKTLPGTVKYIEVNCDSIVKATGNTKKNPVSIPAKTVRIPYNCPASDTIEHWRLEVQESTIAVDACIQKNIEKDDVILNKEKKISELQKALSFSIWAIIILAGYTAIRWIALWLFKVRLP